MPGISAGRNRALDETTHSDLLAFIDDDEEPQDGWLTTLVDIWRAGEPGGVVGRVVSRLTGDVDPWVAAGDFWVRRRHATGTEVPMAAAGNLLLDLRQVRPTGVRFSDRLGLTGGEDSLFTRQLHRAGLRFVWCDESIAVDVLDVSRLDRGWVLKRARSHGNRFGLVELMLAESGRDRAFTRVKLTGKGAAIVGVGVLRYVRRRADPLPAAPRPRIVDGPARPRHDRRRLRRRHPRLRPLSASPLSGDFL